tara:strand:- start:306 stop:587 length:282 start_codon:yes stop_codon:yes gene_type:complete
MNRKLYYAKRTDRQRLVSSQRQVMSLEQRIKELEQEIVRLTIDSDNQREQTPMHMLHTLETCHNYIEQDGDYSLRDYNAKLAEELREVITFLQ